MSHNLMSFPMTSHKSSTDFDKKTGLGAVEIGIESGAEEVGLRGRLGFAVLSFQIEY